VPIITQKMPSSGSLPYGCGPFYSVRSRINGTEGLVAHCLDELGYRPFAQSGAKLLFYLVSRLYERASLSSPPISPLVKIGRR
jgi:hypothetical protein